MKRTYTKKTFSQVVKNYRKDQHLTVRGFAAELSDAFDVVPLSYETVSRWERLPEPGPDLYFLINCYVTYKDWRSSFAAESLCAIMPQIFKSKKGILQLVEKK